MPTVLVDSLQDCREQWGNLPVAFTSATAALAESQRKEDFLYVLLYLCVGIIGVLFGCVGY